MSYVKLEIREFEHLLAQKIKLEQFKMSKTIYIKSGNTPWSCDTVITDDEAVESLAKQITFQKQEIANLYKELGELKTKKQTPTPFKFRWCNR